MPDEQKTATEVKKEEPKEPTSLEPGQVGARTVGPIGIVLIMAYLILFSILLLHGVVQFWPPATPAEGTAPISSPVTFLLWTFSISNEMRLFLIVGLAGALGSLVHALRSLYWYVGNRALVWSWLAKYILLPFIGSTLAFVFYFVLRAGLFSPQATVEEASPFGFAALAGLIGMFSDQAAEKLKEVAATLLAPTPKGTDYAPPTTEEESKEPEPDAS